MIAPPEVCGPHYARDAVARSWRWSSFAPSVRLGEEEGCGSGFALDRLETLSCAEGQPR